MKTDERNKFAIKSFLGEYLDLKKDKDNEMETVDSIRKGVEFKGANLWILIFAIFMASLGLNVNSTAVIEELPHHDCFQCDDGNHLLSFHSYCRSTIGAVGAYFAYDL